MGSVESFKTRAEIVDTNIESQFEAIVSANPIKLPKPDAKISNLYVEKIQGKYNVERAKQDTDAAIDLLYIAYNTTPPIQGVIRSKIGNEIMPALIVAQQKSALAMRLASTTAGLNLEPLSAIFDDWLDVRDVKSVEDAAGVEGVKEFIRDDVIKMAKALKEEALKIKTDLEVIAATYDKIIKDTADVTSISEQALATSEEEKEALEDEINESNAKREQLQSLVTDLQREVDKYDKLARDYATRAGTAEERAFIMSIVQVGAQMLAAAIPAIVTALTASATGGASVVAGAAANTVKRAVGDKNAAADDVPGSDKKVIETKRKISEKKADADASKAKVDKLKTKVNGLDSDLKKEIGKGKPPVPKKKPKKAPAGKDDAKTPAADKDADADADDADDTPAVTELKKRVQSAKKELATETEKYEGLIAALSGLQASLKALEKGLGELTETQQNEAAGLRALQMKMLDKVEAYERERRTQNAELVKINALLKGNLSKAETITLTIRSLNLSIAALKRVQEIITELAYFFMSFAAFMESVSAELDNDLKRFEDIVGRPKIRQNAFTGLIAAGDRFFIRQAAEWHAIKYVTQKFDSSFEEGQSKLNKLRGKYYHGEELKAYLQTAAVKLEEIVAERDADSAQRIVDLGEFRQGMIASAMM